MSVNRTEPGLNAVGFASRLCEVPWWVVLTLCRSSLKAVQTKVKSHAGKAKATVYPCYQRRSILSAMQLTAEATTFLGTHIDDEGLRTTPTSKVAHLQKRLSEKFTKEDFVQSLTASNEVIYSELEDADEESKLPMKELGAKLRDRGARQLDHLGLLENVLTSTSCTDDSKMEFSPAFVLRAFTDAKRSGLALGSWPLSVAIHRQVESYSRDFKFNHAIAVADQDSHDCQHGMQLLKDQPKLLAEAQSVVAATIVASLLEAKKTGALDEQCVRTKASELAAVTTSEPVRASLRHFGFLV